MNEIGEVKVLGRPLRLSTLEAVKSHWQHAQRAREPITKFDSFSKGWDRLSAGLFPDSSSSTHRFKKLTGLCKEVAHLPSIRDLLCEPGSPIRDDHITSSAEVQADFHRAQREFRSFQQRRIPGEVLLESIGRLLWTIRSNSMHGYKTPSGPAGPSERDEQICGLASKVMADLYACAFPDW
jgi:hypothetical protein